MMIEEQEIIELDAPRCPQLNFKVQQRWAHSCCG
jgi:hypothetical protein